MEARGGCPFPPQGHWRVTVGNRGAVRPSNPRSNGSSRHVEPQPAQPVEGHGGHLYEAQREPGRQPRLHSPTHRVLTLAFPTASVTSHFPLCLQLYSHLLYYASIILTPAAASLPSFFSFFCLLTPPFLCKETQKPCHISGYGGNLESFMVLILLEFLMSKSVKRFVCSA